MRHGTLADFSILVRYWYTAVWTDISVYPGRFSILENGRSHRGQGLVIKEGVVKLLPSLFGKKKKKRNVTIGLETLSCRNSTCLTPVTGRRF